VTYLDKGASVSNCGAYRYSLYRIWDRALPRLGVVMLNPSTADGSQDDPTIRKVVEFAKRLGFGSIEVCNLFAFRATDPKDLWAKVKAEGTEVAFGPANLTSILCMQDRASAVLMAWGAEDARGNMRHARRIIERQGILKSSKLPWFVLRLTKDGSPRHPLYVPYAAVDEVKAKYPVVAAIGLPTPGGQE
jgi:hypothetical protein